MKVSKIGAMVLGVAVAIGGLGFSYNEIKKADAKVACDKAAPVFEQGAKLAQSGVDDLQMCIIKAKQIPFKSAEIEVALAQGEAALPILRFGAAFAEGLNQSTATPVQPVASPVAVVSPAPAQPTAEASTPKPVLFESLSQCGQLDALAKGGKSVSEFILSSADPNAYIHAVKVECNWHQSQADVAWNVLNPPAIVVQPTVVERSVSVSTSSGSSWQPAAPSPRYNNCNGIQEWGEAYSAECDQKQAEQQRPDPVRSAWNDGRGDNWAVPERHDNGYNNGEL